MNTNHTAAPVSGNEQDRWNYLKAIIGKEPPRIFTDWQTELLISTAIDRLIFEMFNKLDAAAVCALMDEINLIKEQLPEVFTPAPGTSDFQQWKDAVTVKAYYFPEHLTPKEKAIIPQITAAEPLTEHRRTVDGTPPHTAPANHGYR